MEYFKTPENVNDGLTNEERELANSLLPLFENRTEIERHDCESEIVELENMFAVFELEQPITELYNIVKLHYKEAANHPLRETARIALIPIEAKLKVLETETNIDSVRFNKLHERYNYLSKAVGLISGEDTLRH